MDSILTYATLFVILVAGGIVIDWMLAPDRYDADTDDVDVLPALKRAVDTVRRL